LLLDGSVGWGARLSLVATATDLIIADQTRTPPSPANGNGFVARLNRDLTTAALAAAFGGTGDLLVSAVTADSAGNLLAGGFFMDALQTSGVDTTPSLSGTQGQMEPWLLRESAQGATSLVQPGFTVHPHTGDRQTGPRILALDEPAPGRLAMAVCAEPVDLTIPSLAGRSFAAGEQDIGFVAALNGAGVVNAFTIIHSDGNSGGNTFSCNNVTASAGGTFAFTTQVTKALVLRKLGVLATQDQVAVGLDVLSPSGYSEVVQRVDAVTASPMDGFVGHAALPGVPQRLLIGAVEAPSGGLLAWGQSNTAGFLGYHQTCGIPDATGALANITAAPTDGNQTYFITLPARVAGPCTLQVPVAGNDTGGTQDAPLAVQATSVQTVQLESMDDVDCYAFALTPDQLPNMLTARTLDGTGGCTQDTVLYLREHDMDGNWVTTGHVSDDTTSGPCSELSVFLDSTRTQQVCLRAFAGQSIAPVQLQLAVVPSPANSLPVSPHVIVNPPMGPGDTVLLQGTLLGSGDDLVNSTCGAGTGGADVFYTFDTQDPSELELRVLGENGVGLALGTGIAPTGFNVCETRQPSTRYFWLS